MSERLELTPARRMALIVGVPLALVVLALAALIAVAWAGRGDYRVGLSVPVPAGPLGGQTDEVSVGSGSIALVAGSGRRLAVTGVARYAIFRPRVTWSAGARGVSVAGRCRQFIGLCSFDLRVAVPPGLAARASDNSGNVSASGLTGGVSLSTDSGNVTLSSVSGVVGASTNSGEVTGSGVSGSRLTVADQSGTISVAGLAVPRVTIRDNSGDITLTFTAVPDSVTVSDQSGNVTLVLPRGGIAYDVTATTASGATSVGVPQNPASGHVITVTDQSGDIRISQ